MNTLSSLESSLSVPSTPSISSSRYAPLKVNLRPPPPRLACAAEKSGFKSFLRVGVAIAPTGSQAQSDIAAIAFLVFLMKWHIYILEHTFQWEKVMLTCTLPRQDQGWLSASCRHPASCPRDRTHRWQYISCNSLKKEHHIMPDNSTVCTCTCYRCIDPGPSKHHCTPPSPLQWHRQLSWDNNE